MRQIITPLDKPLEDELDLVQARVDLELAKGMMLDTIKEGGFASDSHMFWGRRYHRLAELILHATGVDPRPQG
jgi:hypothetical protein